MSPTPTAVATTREEEANEFIAPLVGLPVLPCVTWQQPRPVPLGRGCWKTPEVVAWAAGRPFAWVDDEITRADRDWVAQHHLAPALLHRVDATLGLTAEDFAALSDWSTSLT